MQTYYKKERERGIGGGTIMGHSTGYWAGVACGILTGLIAAVAMIKAVRKDGRLKCRYDERQTLVLGKSFKYGFYVLIICLILDIFLGHLAEAYVEHGVLEFLCVVVGIIVEAGYAIWHDGYFSLNEYPRRIVFVFLAIFLMNLVISIRYMHEGELIKDGVVTLFATNLICAVLLLVIVLMILARYAYRKRQDEG